jgi:hypothetical protein
LQLGEAPQLEKVNEAGEFKRGTIGEAKESYRVETYGKVVGITRQVLVNDDLDAFTRVPSLFEPLPRRWKATSSGASSRAIRRWPTARPCSTPVTAIWPPLALRSTSSISPTLLLNGRVRRIGSHMLKPGPQGDGAGEVYLVLADEGD